MLSNSQNWSVFNGIASLLIYFFRPFMDDYIIHCDFCKAKTMLKLHSGPGLLFIFMRESMSAEKNPTIAHTRNAFISK